VELVVAGIVGFLLGALIGWLAASRQTAVLRERVTQLQGAEQQVKDSFRAMAGDALQDFLKVAGEKQKAIDEMLRPLSDAISRYQTQTGVLDDHVTSLQAETHKLAEVMRTGTARGKWGQVALEQIVELAGMTAHVDYVTQTGAGGLIPDVIVKMPAGRSVAVDAKFPFDAYQAAQEARTEEERAAALTRHAEAFKTHVTALSAKEYWKKLESPLDLVVLFVPNDSVVAAAATADPSLVDRALEKRVIIATPFTLLALLKAIELGWREEKMAENAQKISEAGRTVHERAYVLLEHLQKIGRGLGGAVKAYNEAAASVDARFMPAVRELENLGARSGKEVQAPEPVDEQVNL
jgi:DNA recombination protein RmuC